MDRKKGYIWNYCLNFLLTKVQPQIQRSDTNSRNAIPVKTKLQEVLHSQRIVILTLTRTTKTLN